MCLFEHCFHKYSLLVFPLTVSLEQRALTSSFANQALVVISESSLVYFCDFMVGFTAELLRKENTHLHVAKHRQGARSVLLQYLISVRQTSFWKELMFLSIQFWFTVQHFPRSNTLGNCIFLFSFYLYSWIKWRNYWFMLQPFFPLAVNHLQHFLLLVCCMSHIPCSCHTEIVNYLHEKHSGCILWVAP